MMRMMMNATIPLKDVHPPTVHETTECTACCGFYLGYNHNDPQQHSGLKVEPRRV